MQQSQPSLANVSTSRSPGQIQWGQWIIGAQAMTDFSAFVPQALRDVVVSAGPMASMTRRASGVAAFIDVAGFTPLAEALGEEGAIGTERLTDVINTIFGPAVSILARAGGDIVGFEGDAVTAFFDGTATTAAAAVQAVEDVLGHVAALEPVATVNGPIELQVSAGMAAGEVQHVAVGRPGTRRALCLGEVIGRAGELQGTAAPGEVSIEPVVHELSTEPAVPRAPAGPAAGSGSTTEAFADFVPTPVATLIGNGRERFVDEHRPAVVLFGQVSYDTVDQLQAHLDHAAGVISSTGGTLISVAAGDKGTVYVAAWGAPEALADAPAAALRAAEGLFTDDAVDLRVGVCGGPVFAGLVGAPSRRVYTVMGDTVNAAARIMQAAPIGTALVDHRILDASRLDPTVAHRRRLDVKGKAAALEVAELVSLRDNPQRRVSIVDRIDVVADLRAAVDRSLDATSSRRARTGGVVLVVGQTGIGKSRIIEAALADRPGVDLHRTRLNVGGPTWYRPWQSIAASLLGLGRPTARAVAASLAEIGPGLESRADLWLDLLGLTSARPSLGSSRADEIAMARHEAFLEGLTLRSAVRPQLVWLSLPARPDPFSVALLDHLHAALKRFPVCLVVETPVMPEISGAVASMEVGPLEPADAAELGGLLIQQLEPSDGRDVADADRDVVALAAHAEGNPLYLEHLVDALGTDESFSGTHGLRGAITARLDQLGPEHRALVCSAAVVGESFTYQTLSGACGEHLPGLTRRTTEAAVSAGVLERTGPATYAFRSMLLRETAYELLSQANRRSLHHSTGCFLESLSDRSDLALAEALGHHFGETDDVDRQRRYFAMAGRQAAEAFATRAALDWFDRALAVALPDDRPDLQLWVGRVHFAAGALEEAIEAFRSLVDQGSDTTAPTVRRQAAVHLGRALAFAGRTVEAQVVLDRHEVPQDDELRVAWLDARALTAFYRGELELGLELAEEQHRRCRLDGDRVGEAKALALRSSARSALGFDDGLTLLEEAMRLLPDDAEGRWLACTFQDDHGIDLMEAGRYPEALTAFAEAMELAEAMGNGYQQGQILAHEAYARLRLGDIHGADAAAHCALELAVDRGALGSTVPALGILAACKMEGRSFDEAESLFDRVGGLARSFGDPHFTYLAAVSRSEALLARGDPAAARALVTDLDDADALDARVQARRLVVVAITGQRPSDELADVAADFADSPDATLLVDLARWRLGDDRVDARRLAEQAEALHDERPEHVFRSVLAELGAPVPEPLAIAAFRRLGDEPRPLEELLSDLELRRRRLVHA